MCVQVCVAESVDLFELRFAIYKQRILSLLDGYNYTHYIDTMFAARYNVSATDLRMRVPIAVNHRCVERPRVVSQPQRCH